MNMWRVSSEKNENKNAEYTFLGCSMCTGTWNNYESSIVGQIEKKLKLKVIISMLVLLWQTILYFEENFHRIKNTEICILYGSWLANRSIMEQCFPTIFRPILKLNILK